MINEFTISSQDVLETETRLANYLNAKVPGLNVKPGTSMYDILIRSLSYAVTIVRKEADNVRQYSSVTKLANLTDTTARLAFEDLMANWFIDRRQGGVATGYVRVYVSRPYELTINKSIEFSRGIVSFSPSFSTESRTYASTDFFQEDVQSGNSIVQAYYIDIPVSSNISGEGSLLIPGNFESDQPIPSLIKISNILPFSEVTEQETNLEMLDRAKRSISYRGFVTSKAISATLLDLNIPGVTRSIVCTSGDKEILRDIVNPTSTPVSLSTIESISNNIFHGLGVADVVIFPQAQDELYKETSTAQGEIQISKSIPLANLKAVYSQGTYKYPTSVLAAKNIYGDACTLRCSLKYLVSSDSYDIQVSKEAVGYQEAADEVMFEYSGSYFIGNSVTLTGLSASVQHSIYLDTFPSVDTANSLVQSDGLKCAVGSVELRCPTTIVLIIKSLRVIPNLNSPLAIFPYEAIRASISRFIESYDQANKLSAYAIAKYVQDSLYQFIGAVDLTTFSAEYVVVDQNNSKLIPFETSNEVNVEDLSLIKSVSNINKSTIFSSAKESILGLSNRSSRIVCRPSNITIQVG